VVGAGGDHDLGVWEGHSVGGSQGLAGAETKGLRSQCVGISEVGGPRVERLTPNQRHGLKTKAQL
jgi:hypothetical protein